MNFVALRGFCLTAALCLTASLGCAPPAPPSVDTSTDVAPAAPSTPAAGGNVTTTSEMPGGNVTAVVEVPGETP